jgi:hypothetical protein
LSFGTNEEILKTSQLFIDVLFIIFVGEFVVQYKFTVLLMPNGPLKITGLPFESELYESDKSIQDEEIKVCIFVIIKKRKFKK